MSKSLPSLNALRAFEATARLGSVSQAAAELYVTHGAISRQIRSLEGELGLSLFTRQGRGLVLTAEGRYLQHHAGAAFEQLQHACQQLQQQHAQAALVLGCPGSLLARWMIPRLDQLEKELPQLRLHLSATDAPPDSQLEGLDAALLSASAPYPASWQVHVLAPERIGAVISPQHPRFEQLCDAPLQVILQEPLLHTSSRPQAWPDWARLQALEVSSLQMGTGFEHLYYLLEAVITGLGIAVAPEPLVAQDIASGRLVAPWGFVQTDSQWVLCASSRSVEPRVAQLAQWLRIQLNA